MFLTCGVFPQRDVNKAHAAGESVLFFLTALRGPIRNQRSQGKEKGGKGKGEDVG